MQDKHLAKSTLSGLQQYMSDVEAIPVGNDVVLLLAGNYSTGDIHGGSIHLFPDGSYIYRWGSDAGGPSVWITDTGKWTYQSSLIQIHSDGKYRLKPDSSYLPFMGACPKYLPKLLSGLGKQPPAEKIVWLVAPGGVEHSWLKEHVFPDFAEKKGTVSDIGYNLMHKMYSISSQESPDEKQKILTLDKETRSRYPGFFRDFP